MATVGNSSTILIGMIKDNADSEKPSCENKTARLTAVPPGTGGVAMDSINERTKAVTSHPDEISILKREAVYKLDSI